MKKYIFPVFITLLGLIAAYVFYTLWHTEVLNPVPLQKKVKEKTIEDLSNKKIIPKKTTTVFPKVPSETIESSPEVEKQITEEMKKQENIPNLTPQEMEAQTQEVYDSLIPADYEETMEEAEAAFKKLDEDVILMEEKLAQEEQERSEEESITSEDVSEDTEALEVLQNEEETDIEQEDINNP